LGVLHIVSSTQYYRRALQGHLGTAKGVSNPFAPALQRLAGNTRAYAPTRLRAYAPVRLCAYAPVRLRV